MIQNILCSKIITEFKVDENDIFGNVKFLKPLKGKKAEWIELANKNANEGLLNQATKYQKYAQSLDFLEKSQYNRRTNYRRI